MKVLEVIRQGKVGGGESHVIDLVNGLREKGVDVEVLTFTTGMMVDRLLADGVKCTVLETNRAFDFKVMRNIKQFVRNGHFDIVHAHGSRAASNMLWPAWSLGIPLVYTVHGWSFHAGQSKIIQKLRAWSEKLICSVSKQVICVSHSNRMTGIYSFGLRNAMVIENGINLQRFNATASCCDVRAELHIPPEEFIVGFIARLSLQKCPLDFVKAVARAHVKYPMIKGLIVGDGEMKTEVYEYIVTHQLEDVFYLQGFRSDVPDLMKAIDVFVLPSLWEGHPIALLEAMAMEKAIIATPTDGSFEIVKNHKSGILVDYHHPEMIADAILNYYDHPKMKARYEHMAKVMVELLFDSKAVAEQVYEIYNNILTHKNKRKSKQ